MPNWMELIDLARFEALLRAVAVGLPVVAVFVGWWGGRRRGRPQAGLVRGVAAGLSGPLVYGLWRLFSWLVRYDPVTGYCGLHRLWVLWVAVAIFTAVGLILGEVYRRLWQATSAGDPAADGKS